MQISYLVDHPEFVTTLASWIFEHWRPVLAQETLESRIAKFRTHLNRDALPIAWVAHSQSQIFGTAALRVHDLPDREDLTPWLGGMYVASPFRRRGIGAALCEAVEQKARTLLETQTLYLFTLDKQTWYKDRGWSMHEPCSWFGRAGDIMIKELHVA